MRNTVNNDSGDAMWYSIDESSPNYNTVTDGFWKSETERKDVLKVTPRSNMMGHLVCMWGASSGATSCGIVDQIDYDPRTCGTFPFNGCDNVWVKATAGPQHVMEALPITGGNLLVAMDRQAYEGLWVEGQMVGRLPEVDFSSEIVVRADRFSNDDCDEVIFESLDKVPGENAVELTFKPPSGSACRSFGVSHVVFIAVEKESLPKAPLEFRLGEGHGALAAEVASL